MTIPLSARGRTWRLAVTPSPATLDENASGVPLAFLLSGLGMALFTAMLMRAAQRSNDKSPRLAVLLESLAAENEGRRLAERWRDEHAVELIAQAEQLAFQNDVLQSTAVEMDAPREAAAVTDPGKLTQVLINLIGNAIKFTPRGGEVRVRVVGDADDSRVASIGVSDTGIGIARDRLHAIFEAFEQADEETSRRYGGTGLGLAISQQLCTLMGHQLAVESEVGSGSRFTVLLSAKRLEHAA